jgi:hypothetical protein
VSIAVLVAVVVFGVIFPQLDDWNEVFEILREVDKVDFALILLLGFGEFIQRSAEWLFRKLEREAPDGFLGDVIARLNASTTAMLAQVGGMLLATIGTQLLLGGIRNFYEF